MKNDDVADLQDFAGVARLFPLPNLVLFPCMKQALHIFEPRYRQMTADALADDRLLAMVLLRPGWEADYEGRPPLYPIACLGKIMAHQRLDDGRFDLQLRGLCRIRILEEIDDARLYRSARVELLRDRPIVSKATGLFLRRRLLGLVPVWCSSQVQVLALFLKVLKSDLPLGTISDLIGFALPLPLALKQDLLANPDVEQRVRGLIEHLEKHKPVPSAPPATLTFPPDFSPN